MINYNINNRMYRAIFNIAILIVGCMLIIPGMLNAQDKEQLKSRLGLNVIQLDDNAVQLNILLRARVNKVYRGIENAAVKIIGEGSEENIDLDVVRTDKHGKVKYVINDLGKLERNEDGYITLLAEFDGNEEYRASDRDVQFKTATIKLEAFEEDSIHKLKIMAFEPDSMLPLAEQVVTISVPRLFGDLVIVEEETDDDGILEIKFPSDIMVHEGNDLEISAAMYDTDDYGTLSTKLRKPWGISPVKVEQAERALWSPNAPLWMVITFAALMTIVWGHFMIIGYKLFLIQKEGIS